MSLEQDVASLGVLVEPQRQKVYEHLAAAAVPPTLAEVAGALGLGRTLLAFHLGKLVEAGFVEVLPAAPTEGRRGRPSQRYRTTRREVAASVPARRYELVAEVLLASADEAAQAAALTAARARGAEVAAAEATGRRPTSRNGRLLQVERVLRRLGYAPRRDGDSVVLTNCPFDRLRETNLGLVCGINHALAEGYLEGLGAQDDLTAELRPCSDLCCVVVT